MPAEAFVFFFAGVYIGCSMDSCNYVVGDCMPTHIVGAALQEILVVVCHVNEFSLFYSYHLPGNDNRSFSLKGCNCCPQSKKSDDIYILCPNLTCGTLSLRMRTSWLLLLLLWLLLSHINSCKKSRVRGYTKVLKPNQNSSGKYDAFLVWVRRLRRVLGWGSFVVSP